MLSQLWGKCNLSTNALSDVVASCMFKLNKNLTSLITQTTSKVLNIPRWQRQPNQLWGVQHLYSRKWLIILCLEIIFNRVNGELSAVYRSYFSCFMYIYFNKKKRYHPFCFLFNKRGFKMQRVSVRNPALSNISTPQSQYPRLRSTTGAEEY